MRNNNIQRLAVILLCGLICFTYTPGAAFAGTEENADPAVAEQQGGIVSDDAGPEIPEAVIGETISETSLAEGAAADGDELLMQFLKKKVSEETGITFEGEEAAPETKLRTRGAKNKRADSLAERERYVYDQLISSIRSVVEYGELTTGSYNMAISVEATTVIFGERLEVTDDELAYFEAVASQTGGFVPKVKVSRDAYDNRNTSVDFTAINQTILTDNPYEMYWFDKKTGSSSGISVKGGYTYNGFVFMGEDAVITVKYAVSEDYRTEGASDIYQLDASKVLRARAAAANAADIINVHAGESDLTKLTSYKDEICEATAYDHAAADDDSTPYGDPWQMISVFDGDAATNVVCEGYSKAFQFLCDGSSFENDATECFTVSGTMQGATGAGGHMWNTLHMDDGRYYLADITNCDEGTAGAPDQLFLKGAARGSVQAGYVYICGQNHEITYTYNDRTLGLFTDELVMSETDYEEAAPHQHDLVHHARVEASCTAAGNIEYWECSVCQRKFSDADGNSEISGTVEIGKLDHTYDQQVAAAEYLKTPADCTHKAVYYKSCTCGAFETGETAATFEYGEADPNAHTSAAAVIENEVAATCTSAGSYDEVVYCTACSTELSRTKKTIAKKAHTSGAAVRENEVASTCTSAGSYDEVVYCTVCNTELSRTEKTTPAFGHKYGDWQKNDTETHKKICENDPAHVQTEEHKWDAGTVTKAATCKETGIKAYACSVCGETKKEVIPKLNTHTPGAAVRENEVAATCASAGSYDEVVYCTTCSTELSRTKRTVAKKAHAAGAAVRENEVAATCTSAGSYDEVVYCSVCGTELSRTKRTVAKKAHTAGAAVRENEVAATCTSAGSYDEVVYCTTCSTELSRTKKTITKKAHSSGAAVRENEVAATCTSTGSYDEVVYCTVCNTELSRRKKTTEALGHEYLEVPGSAAEPTYDAPGKTSDKKCTRCDSVIPGESIPKLAKTAINKKMAAAIKDQVYNGKARTPAVVITLEDGTVLKKGTDYTLKYANNKAVGTAKVTVTGKGKYEGIFTVTFNIVPKGTTLGKLTGAKKAATIKWTAQTTQTKGYEIQLALNNKFTSGKKTVTINNNKTKSKNVSGLKAKKKYYVRIRTFKLVGGKKYYSAWSAVKTVTTKK